MAHTQSPLDQPYSRPGHLPESALCYKHIKKKIVGKQGQAQKFLATISWWVTPNTGLQYRDIKNLKHLTRKDIWVKFLDKLSGATPLRKCYSWEHWRCFKGGTSASDTLLQHGGATPHTWLLSSKMNMLRVFTVSKSFFSDIMQADDRYKQNYFLVEKNSGLWHQPRVFSINIISIQAGMTWKQNNIIHMSTKLSCVDLSEWPWKTYPLWLFNALIILFRITVHCFRVLWWHYVLVVFCSFQCTKHMVWIKTNQIPNQTSSILQEGATAPYWSVK